MLDVASIIMSTVTGQAERFIAQKRRNAMLYSLVGLFIITAYVFGLIALYQYLSSFSDSQAIAILIGVVSLSFSILILSVILGLNVRDRRIQNKNKAIRSMASKTALSIASQSISKQKHLPAMILVSLALASAIAKGTSARSSRPQEVE